MATATGPRAVPSRSQARFVFFAVFFALTVFAIYDKDARVFDPTSPIARHFAPVKWYLAVHGSFAAIAMLVAVFQFSDRLRAQYLWGASFLYANGKFKDIVGPHGEQITVRGISSRGIITGNMATTTGPHGVIWRLIPN